MKQKEHIGSIILLVIVALAVSLSLFSCKDASRSDVQNNSDVFEETTIADLLYNPATHALKFKDHIYKMRYVEGGRFKMGSLEGESQEQPVHQVTLDGYYIGQSEIPQWLWIAVMSGNPSEWKEDNLPVEKVSWDDCQEFIAKLNSATGASYVLPTEAQWEFAARGGNSSEMYVYSGSNNIDEVAWYQSNSDNMTHDVKMKLPNELGLYDMTGNVWEWCLDYYDENYYSISPYCDPCNDKYSSKRVLRGGSWYNIAQYCRSTLRYSAPPTSRFYRIGLRLAL